jgi:hypothetical protein
VKKQRLSWKGRGGKQDFCMLDSHVQATTNLSHSFGGSSRSRYLAKAQLEVVLERTARSVLVQPRDAKQTILKRRRARRVEARTAVRQW